MVFSKVWQVAMDRTMYKITCLQLLLRRYGIIGGRGHLTRVEVRHAFTLSCRAVPYRAGTVDSTVPAGTVRYGTARVRIGKIYSRAVPYRADTVKNCQCERSIKCLVPVPVR